MFSMSAGKRFESGLLNYPRVRGRLERTGPHCSNPLALPMEVGNLLFPERGAVNEAVRMEASNEGAAVEPHGCGGFPV